LFSEQFYGYLRADGLHDSIADMDYRLTVGPGLGYYLLKETNTTLAVEAGGAFEAEKRGSQSDSFATLRLGERFEHKFNARARVWESLEVLPQVDKFDNYLVNFEIGLEASLTKSFSLKTFLDDNYQNQPARGKLKNDAKIISAVSYKF
jgi:putative salt-induced outer membrane protein YdiY